MPFSFTGIKASAKHGYRPLMVATKWQSLGRFPESYGDYSIEGYAGQVGIERKSMEDVQSTILGWKSKYEKDKGLPGRRERFKRELQNLANMKRGLVVVECSVNDCLRFMPSWGKRTSAQNASYFFKALASWTSEFGPIFQFLDNRRMAEMFTFRTLQKFWEKNQ